ncbi:histamine N-methyltransferase-like [Montipora foliosa]|uniref:histamine N-methyltransferase-like n=1 Tax=Montipora foliosa TaxID=591990 RepID=UPI0035F17FB2
MSSFPLNAEMHYVESLKIFDRKSGQIAKNKEMLREHIPSLVPRMLHHSQQLNILSVGSGNGEKDLFILKTIKENLPKTGHGSKIKIFNRAIEPNSYSRGLYNTVIENLPASFDDQETKFEICPQTFQEYSQYNDKEPIKFDLVHFIHSIYYVDMEKALCHCFEKELVEKGVFVCIVSGRYWHGQEDGTSENLEKAEKLVEIAKSKAWKHEVYTREYSIDVTDVFDPKSIEGNLLLDFLTHMVNFRETAEKQLVEGTLSLIRDHTTLKSGKRLGKKKDSLIAIYRQ